MNKKGFTLIELVGSVVILAAMALIAFPALLSMLDRGQKDVDAKVRQLVENAAEEYVNDHIDNYNNPVTVCTLLDEGYVSTTFYKKYQEDIEHATVKITKATKYSYEFQPDTNSSNCRDIE